MVQNLQKTRFILNLVTNCYNLIENKRCVIPQNSLDYSMIGKEINKGIKNMSLKDKKVWLNGSDYIELDSVGSTLTSELNVFPIDCSEAPETASEAEEMMGVHIYDTTDEWWSNLSFVDGTDVLEFIELNTDIVSKTIFNDWKESKLDLIGCVDTLSEVI